MHRGGGGGEEGEGEGGGGRGEGGGGAPIRAKVYPYHVGLICLWRFMPTFTSTSFS